jgi:F-type H+-transporting ATPase subunit gamma
MASTRELRRRIRSVKSTKQITKAMELVSASKMRRASTATIASRPYATRLHDMVSYVLQDESLTGSHPLLEKREVKKVLIVAIASDRGLAGAYNSTVYKKAIQLQHELKSDGAEVGFITWGKKMATMLHRGHLTVKQTYDNASSTPNPQEVVLLSQYLCTSFQTGTYDQIYMVFTEFHSMLRQEVTELQVLPILSVVGPSKPVEFLIEPSAPEVLSALLPRVVEVELYQAILESLASEHSARRMAMRNATDNASSMIDDLTLTYNGVRQGAITQELAEITSGAASLSN